MTPKEVFDCLKEHLHIPDPFYKDCNDDFEEIFAEAISNLPGYWNIQSGASRVCLIPDDENFVIKIPFRGDEDDGDFYGARAKGKRCWDYCATEVKLYYRAKSKKIAPVFAKEYKIGEIDGYPIYVQTKVLITCDKPSSSSLEKKYKVSKKVEKFVQNSRLGDHIDSFWAQMVTIKYGELFFNALEKFFDEYCIWDLHNGNIGFDENDNPVIFDYASFNQ